VATAKLHDSLHAGAIDILIVSASCLAVSKASQ